MSALLPVWSEIEKYIDNGISVIPVRDKTDAYGQAKSPYGRSWKEYQERIIGKDELFDLMDVRYNTTAVGIVGGKVSGNLEIIDIDVKFKEGIDATLFTDLKAIYPEILRKLRIHGTPSGGYHILYRVDGVVEGNQKLAGRNKTEEELKEQPRPKTVNFLETRGEGGYVVAPPAMGYSVKKDTPVTVLSQAERNSIITLCRSYNEIITPEKTAFRPTKAQESFYDLNPFDDFNLRCDPTALVQEFGWKEYKHSNRFIWYTRPGKSKGVSMSFNLEKRFFFCFTASTELEENKGYSPANLLATLAHNGDKKRLYADLVSRGFGSIKPKVEQRLIRQAALSNKSLPPNVSSQATAQLEAAKADLNEKHPFGIFWMDSEKHGVQIDRELLYRVAEGLGFMLWHGEIVQSDGKYIDRVTTRHFYDALKAYIKEEDADFYKDICNAYESFIEKHGKFTITRLPILDESKILNDTKTAAYKVYQNGILKITAKNMQMLLDLDIDKLIWRHSVRPRAYRPYAGGKYAEFLKLALNYDENDDYVNSIIGYLAHEYKDETAGYIIVLTEECEDPKDGGGAGKNVFSNLFREITSFTSKPGAQVKTDEKFFQSWNYQKIFCISDVHKNFDYSFLKEMSTGTGIMKKLFKDENEISPDLMPKFLIQTNYSVEIKDGGLRRRVKIIEFSDFFTQAGGIDVHFGAHFPGEWNDDDWAGYDTIMANAVQTFLRSGRKIGKSVLSTGGWLKQFRQTHGAVVTDMIQEYMNTWLQKGYVTNDEFKTDCDTFYNAQNIPKQYQPSSNRIHSALKEWCEKHEIQYLNQISEWSPLEMKMIKKKWFGSKEATPF